MGGDACIRQTRIPVWLLVSLRQQGATEAYLLEDYPTLTAADLVNAWLYADTHSEEIEAAIAPLEHHGLKGYAHRASGWGAKNLASQTQ